MKQRTHLLLNILRAAFGVALLWYVVRTTNGWQLAGVLRANPHVAVLLTAWVLMATTVEAKRLSLLLRSQGIDLPFVRGLRLVSIAIFFGFFVPGGTGGDVAKLYSLAGKRPGQRVEVALVLLVDRAMGLLSLIILVALLALANWRLVEEQVALEYLIGGAVLGALAMLCGVAASWSRRLRASSLAAFVHTRLPGGRYALRMWDALHAFRAHRAALVGGLALSLLGHALLCVLFVAVARQTMPAAPAGVVSMLSLLGMLANAVPLTPAGIGVGEAAFAGLFHLAGYQGGSELVLAWRLGTLQVAIAGGLLWLAGGRRGVARPPGASESGQEHAPRPTPHAGRGQPRRLG
jgi:uncharacterized protein (TIRG00374 family)